MASIVPINQEVERMSSYLASMSFPVTRDWLMGCVEYFREQNQQYSVEVLKEFVRKQWELSDLRDSSGGCLPQNLQTQIKVTLTGKYAVQIESVINICQPAYTQMQRIRKVDLGNVVATEQKPESWEPKPNRMLKLKICDGPQQAEAIEYRPILVLYESILPGTKILISGPVDCRRGIFYLKPENLKIIGGEVDSLLIPNHMENVLARALGLPENPNPLSTNVEDIMQSSTTTLVSDTQRSTYTPSIAPNSEPPGKIYGGQINKHTTVGSTQLQQRSVQEYFRSKPPEEPSVEILQDLDVTNWAMDDFMADDDDEVLLQISEENEIQSVQPLPSATNQRQNTTNSNNNGNKTMDSLGSMNYSLENDQVSSTVQSNKVNTFNMNCKDDEVLLQICEENEIQSAQPLPSATNFYNRRQITTNNNNRNQTMNSLGSMNYTVGNNQVSSAVQSNKVNTVNMNSKAKITQHISINRIEETENLDIELLKQNTPQIISQNSNKSVVAKTKFSSEYSTNSKQEPPWDSDFTRRPSSKVFQQQNEMLKSSNHLIRTNVPSPPSPEVFENEEGSDWADAYLSSQSVSFLQKYDDFDKPSTSKVLVNSPKISPPLSNVSMASKMSNVKLSKPLLGREASKTLASKSHVNSSKLSPSSTVGASKKPSNIVNENEFSIPLADRSSPILNIKQQNHSVNDRSSFNQTRIHLQPAISSPSCMNEKSTTSFKTSQTPSTSSCINRNETSTSSSSKKFLCDTMLSSNKEHSQSLVAVPNSSLKSSAPFVYLMNVFQSPTKETGTHRIKATIISLLSQLKTDANLEWTLSAKICDGTGSLDVQFSSEVLDKLIGLSAVEFKKMKKDLPNNPLLKDKLVKILQKSQQTLVNLNCFFDIKFETDKMVKVVKLTEITAQDVYKMKLRMNNG